MIFSSIMNAITYLWHANKVWHKPKQAWTLIYKRPGSEAFLEYIDQSDVEILDLRWNLRGESINIYVLLKCAFSLKLSRSDYASEYISQVRPSVVITFVHNDRYFYRLKNSHPQPIMVFVQNGLNSEFGDIFGYLKKCSAKEVEQVDYMLTFGAAYGAKFSQYIRGQAIPIGSVKNNMCLPGKEIKAGSLVYISQFRPKPSDPNSVYLSDGTTWFRYDDYYAAEGKLLEFLSRYCNREKLQLRVCGQLPRVTQLQETDEEYEFYSTRIGNTNWEFIPSSSLYGSYQVVDSAEYVVFLESALGYESLARGKRTAAFSIRGDMLGQRSMNFGWPADLPDNGPFWTNHADEREFERVMKYITNVSDEEWERDRLRYVPDLIDYDPGNTRFLDLMRKWGVPLNPEYQTDV